ncbi:MAG TPA: GDP-L-fucose synthase [Pyrinomonadaceae bacterium]|nr:GDP-L-fucose synthase [Pyrinomonadaceae bacterium]
MIGSDKRIFVAGAGGMVGSSVVRALTRDGFTNLITPTSKEVDLTEQAQVRNFFSSASPEIVIVAAAKVGGILANNTYRADFIYQNLMIEANVIRSAFESGIEKLILLGSSCIYPKQASQPMREEELLSGFLEPTNEPYAIAKIAGIKLCESYFRQHGSNFFSLMPTNLYGPNDNFDLQTSHVIPALMRKFHDAKERNEKSVEIWGSGRPRREFMHVDDLADAILFALNDVGAAQIYDQGISHLNVGTGVDEEIIEVARTIKEIVGFDGEIVRDESKPDGTMRKLLDVSRMQGLGWRHKIELRDGLEKVYEWYLRHLPAGRTTVPA